MEEDEEFLLGSSQKRKRLLSDPKSECMIHCSDDASPLITLTSQDSWKTLLNAAVVRNDRNILDLPDCGDDINFPNVTYHCKCRSIYTMKASLEAIETQRQKQEMQTSAQTSADFSSTTKQKKSSRVVGATDANRNILPVLCIFCNKVSCYKSGTKSRERLTQCLELRAHNIITQCATQKKDTRIIGMLAMGDLIAREAHYHKSCYLSYTKALRNAEKGAQWSGDGENKEFDTASRVCDDPAHEVDRSNLTERSNLDLDYHKQESLAYNSLCTHIEKIIANLEIVPFTDLSHMYVNEMKRNGVSEVTYQAKNYNLRRKLENTFRTKLHFVTTTDRHLLVYPDTLSRNELVLLNYNLHRELTEAKSRCSEDQSLVASALIIRNDIKHIVEDESWPPLPDNIKDRVKLPESIQTFYATVLTGNFAVKLASLPQRVKTLMWSFGHDLVNAVTCGKVKTGKHIMLPFAVNALSGHTTELIKLLNRCGHGLSYSQVEEIDTAIAIQKLSASEDANIVLPRNIVPFAFSHLAWDNIDRLEETLSGGNTSHRVNGIIAQPTSLDSSNTEALPAVEKSKRRTLSTDLLRCELSQYNPGCRTGPVLSNTNPVEVLAYQEVVRQSSGRNLMWVLLRAVDTEKQVIPSWTGFNIQMQTLSTKEIVQTNIGYLPTVDAPATSLMTVSEVLRRSKKIKDKLRLESIVCTFDQAMYAKACEIVWKHPELYKDIVLSLGGFHMICNFLGIIGKRFQDAGLRDLLLEAGVIAEGSLPGIMQGKHYNRSVRAHKLVYECLMRLVIQGFEESLRNSDAHQSLFNQVQQDVHQAHETSNSQRVTEIIESASFTKLHALFLDYKDHLRLRNGDLSGFWMSYLDMIETLFHLIGGNREGNWLLYLAGIRDMIPWCFAYDHLNYARYLPFHYQNMLSLQHSHPEVYSAFREGHFSIQMSNSNPFGKIPVDQAIEETINKETQGPSGTIGFSRRIAAVQRHYITSDVKAAFLREIKDCTGNGTTTGVKHTDLSSARKLKDERDVTSLYQLLTNDWIDPFRNMNLICISTGVVAPPNVANDLMHAKAKGEEALTKFKTDHLSSGPTTLDAACTSSSMPTAQFFKPMKKISLKTFSTMTKVKKVVTKDKEIALKADRGLFAKMAVIAQTRQLNMREVLAHPLGPLPWSLATPDGALRKTTKSKLIALLTKNEAPVDNVPKEAAYVDDLMSRIQKMAEPPNTFGVLAKTLLQRALQDSQDAIRLDVVCDVYIPDSIKTNERELRSQNVPCALLVSNLTAAHPIRNWRSFLSEPENKTALLRFIAEEWKRPDYRTLIGKKQLFVTHGQECTMIMKDNVECVLELKCNQEEADTRLLLHANHCILSGHKNVIIHSEDTDVIVLAVHYASRLKLSGGNILIKTGTSNRLRYLNATKIAARLGTTVTTALPGMHTFTGCDTVSAFAGRGKVVAYNLLCTDKEVATSFADLGEQFDVSENLVAKLENVVCKLYGDKNEASINEMRYKLFCAKKGNIESHNLPPCLATLRKHISRANYQAAIWRRSLDAWTDVPHPHGHGWKKTTTLEIDWMDCLPAPDAVLELLFCSCPKHCEPLTCPCAKNGLECTDMCKLQECSNHRQLEEDIALPLSDSESDSDH